METYYRDECNQKMQNCEDSGTRMTMPRDRQTATLKQKLEQVRQVQTERPQRVEAKLAPVARRRQGFQPQPQTNPVQHVDMPSVDPHAQPSMQMSMQPMPPSSQPMGQTQQMLNAHDEP